MSVWLQILLGGFVLVLCTVFHFSLLLSTRPMTEWVERKPSDFRKFLLLCMALGVVVLAHMAQVLIWAAVLIVDTNLDNWEEAIYFSLSTYTTVGYGDVVLDFGMRTFGAMESVNGMLGFGLSTAYLVALATTVFVDRE